VTLYEAMVAAVALLIGSESMAWRHRKSRFKSSALYVCRCCWDIYLCSLYAWWWNVVQCYISC